MNFDPQKFCVGRMDIFSILLPGATPTWLLMGADQPARLPRSTALSDRFPRL
jgi:hypothetical protein